MDSRRNLFFLFFSIFFNISALLAMDDSELPLNTQRGKATISTEFLKRGQPKEQEPDLQEEELSFENPLTKPEADLEISIEPEVVDVNGEEVSTDEEESEKDSISNEDIQNILQNIFENQYTVSVPDEASEDEEGMVNFVLNEIIDLSLVEEVINCAPQEIKDIIACLNNPPRSPKAMPKRLLLVGPPGCGKTTLAKAIALKTGRKYKFIDAPFLLTEYKNSGPQNLQKEILPILASGEPYIIIIDEITCLTDRHKNPYDSDPRVAEALWSILDKCAQNPNIFFIGTSNDIGKLPAPLRSRFGNRGIVEVKLPDYESRVRILKHHLANEQFEFDESYLKKLASKIKGKSGRDIEDLVISAARNAHLRGSDEDIITSDDFAKALKNNKQPGIFKRMYESCKPGTEGFQWIQLSTTLAGLMVSIANLGLSINDLYHRAV